MDVDKLIKEIEWADVDAIDRIMGTVIKRKRELYPDWEIIYCAARKTDINGPEELIRSAWEFDNQLREKFNTLRQIKSK